MCCTVEVTPTQHPRRAATGQPLVINVPHIGRSSPTLASVTREQLGADRIGHRRRVVKIDRIEIVQRPADHHAAAGSARHAGRTFPDGRRAADCRPGRRLRRYRGHPVRAARTAERLAHLLARSISGNGPTAFVLHGSFGSDQQHAGQCQRFGLLNSPANYNGADR